MFYPKSDIFSQSWLDIIFEGRNQQYGAYVLRRDAARHATLALLAASSVFVVTLLTPLIKSRYFTDQSTAGTTRPSDRETVIELTPPPPIDPAVPEPPTAPPPAPRVSQVRMPEPMVVTADRVSEEPPTVSTLKLANPGAENIEGNPGAGIRIDLPVGPGSGDAAITESGAPSDVPFIHVEIEPEFPGGLKAFMAYVQQNYRYPAAAVEAGVKGQVVLQFVVERDGSLTDIKIVRDLKFGTGEEAVRLLQAAPKWSPGIQNGREVRVAYTLPIALDISQ